jgi:cytochrome c oxidase assembly protein subunit 15
MGSTFAAMPRQKEPFSGPVATWVMTGVILLLVQVILGGIVRLTGSGLSITEWDIFTGAIPPLTHMQWQEAFDKYRRTEQFRILNSGFSLSDFKFIFFWEWFHRAWARMVGVVFIIGFIYLLWKKKIKTPMIRPLLILFLLGALQATVGWIMVISGFTGDALYVAPAKLALHFVFALVLIVYALWLLMHLTIPVQEVVRSHTIRGWTAVILLLLFVQLLFGALMAGNKAAAAAPTWPMINGDWVPDGVSINGHILRSVAGNKILIHFIHRNLAYLISFLIIIWTIKAYLLEAVPAYFQNTRWLPMALVVSQIVLGILTLLSSPGIVPNRWVGFDWFAQLHQVVGLLLLLTMTGMLYIVRPIRHSVTV